MSDLPPNDPLMQKDASADPSFQKFWMENFEKKYDRLNDDHQQLKGVHQQLQKDHYQLEEAFRNYVNEQKTRKKKSELLGNLTTVGTGIAVFALNKLVNFFFGHPGN